MTNTFLTNCILNGCKFEHAILQDVCLDDSQCQNTSFIHASLNQVDTNTNTNFAGADFSHATIIETSFHQAALAQVDCLENSSFSNMTLTATQHKLIVGQIDKNHIGYNNITLTYREIKSLIKQGIKDFRGLNLCDYSKTELEQLDFSGADIRNTTLNFPSLKRLLTQKYTVFDGCQFRSSQTSAEAQP